MERGRFELDDALEDIHMNIESRLAATSGQGGTKTPYGTKSKRPGDLDVRMYLRHEVNGILGLLTAFRQALVLFADEHIDVIMPGYTHLQRAQPVLLAHHLMAYYEMFTRDRDRFEGVLQRTNVMPLGSAALAGTTYPIDPAYTAELLDFPEVSANSMDAVSSQRLYHGVFVGGQYLYGPSQPPFRRAYPVVFQ